MRKLHSFLNLILSFNICSCHQYGPVLNELPKCTIHIQIYFRTKAFRLVYMLSKGLTVCSWWSYFQSLFYVTRHQSWFYWWFKLDRLPKRLCIVDVFLWRPCKCYIFIAFCQIYRLLGHFALPQPPRRF